MYKKRKCVWFFINYFALYFVIGLLACIISFPIFGMIFGAPSVIIGAFALSFYRTLVACIQGDLTIDRSYHPRTIIEEVCVIGGIVLLVILIGAYGKL